MAGMDWPVWRHGESRSLRVAVAAAADEEVMAAVRDGLQLGLEFVLIGKPTEIQPLLASSGIERDRCELLEAPDEQAAAGAAVDLARLGRVQILMKGRLTTADFLRPVLSREDGLRTGGLLSHAALIELPDGRKILLTDGGMNIAPSLAEKAEIIKNAAWIARRLGQSRPRAAVLAAIETVNPAMPATLEAAALAKMADRGQLGEVSVEGPLALDNALGGESAAKKGVHGEVAGRADILLVPEIVCGNALYKALVHLAGCRAAGVVVGAAVPLVLTSRSDSGRTKLDSLALAAHLASGTGRA